MRRRTFTSAAVGLASLAALAPAAARATEVQGWIGGDAMRTDYLSDPATHADQLRLAGDVNANGYIGSREDFDWRANVGLSGNRETLPGGTDQSQQILSYGVHGGLFDTRKSSFKLRLDAARTQSNFSDTPPGQSSQPGSSLSNSFGAGVISGGGALPVLSVHAGVDDMTYKSFAQPDIHRKLMDLTASATHGTDDYNWSLGYTGRLETGTLSQDEYVSHYLTANGSSRLADRTNLTIGGQYFTRTPRTNAPFAPKYDDTNLSATLLTPLGAMDGSATYGFSHLVFQAPGVPSSEQTSHNLNAFGAWVLSPEWTLRPTVAGGYSSVRSGGTELTAASETVGGNLQWARAAAGTSYSVTTTATVGASEASNSPTTGAGSLGLAGNLARPLSSGGWGAGYSVDYASNLGGVRGWTVGQSVVGNFSQSLGPQTPLGASLTLTTTRNHSDLLGDGATRTGILNVSLNHARQTYGLSAYLNQGVAPSLGSPVRGDGLVVPFGYDVSSFGGGIFAGSPIGFRWDVFGQVRYGVLSAPQVQDEREFSVQGRVGYRIGQFVLSLDDTYRVYGTTSAQARYNTVMVMFARSFRL